MRGAALLTPEDIAAREQIQQGTLAQSLPQHPAHAMISQSQPTPPVDPLNVFPTGKVREFPSKGVGYAVKYLEYRGLSLGEVLRLNTVDYNIEHFEAVYNNAILNMNFLDLSYQDAVFMCIYILFATSTVHEWKFRAKCPKCKTSFTKQVPADKLEFNDIKAKALPMVLTLKNKDKLVMDMFRVRHQILLKQIDPDQYDMEIAMYALLTMKPGQSFHDAYMYLCSIHPDDVALLRRSSYYIEHGIKSVPHKCENVLDDENSEAGTGDQKICGHEFVIPVSLDFLALVPRFQDEATLDARISFG